MKKIIFLSFLFLVGCANSTKEAALIKEETPFSETAIEVTSGYVKMSVTKPYYAFAKDVVIDISKNGSVSTTYTDVFSGNRVTIEGDCKIINLKDYEIRDWSKK